MYLAWSRRNRSALIRVPLYHPGQGGGHPRRAALPRPRLQPLPVLRGDAAGRASRGSRTATSSPSRWSRTSTTCRPRSAQQRGIEQLPENARRGDRDRRRVGAGPADPRRAHLQALHRDQARASGTTTGSGSRPGRSPVPAGPLTRAPPAAAVQRQRPASARPRVLPSSQVPVPSRAVSASGRRPPALARRFRPQARARREARAPLQPARRRPVADPAARPRGSTARRRTTVTACRSRPSTPGGTTCSGGSIGWSAPTSRWSSA